MTNLMQTGVTGLDRLLGGGLKPHNSVLLKGPPGSGKTTLGLQILVEGARQFDEPGILISFEQFPQQLERDAAVFGWDLRKLADERKLAVFFANPEDLFSLSTRTENPVVSKILEAVEEIGAKRVLIDSVSHLREVTGDVEMSPRQALLRFLNSIKSVGLTPMLTAELGEGGPGYEDYLVDSVIVLHHVRGDSGLPDRRTVEIVKTRGQRSHGGHHPMKIGDAGIEVFPHVRPTVQPPDPGDTPVNSGVEELDLLLGGGFTPATAVLIAGMAGTYKTTLAAQFLAEGLKAGEAALLITFEEPPGHLMHFLANRGVDLRSHLDAGRLEIWHQAPRLTCIEELVMRACELAEKRGLRRVALDSTNDLALCQIQPDHAEQALRLFVAEMVRRGVTVALTQRIERLTGTNPISDIRHVTVVDTIIYLGLAEIESRIEKVISVLKHRGADADAQLRGLICGSDGLEITQGFLGLSGVLGGTPLGQRKHQVEQIFQPLYVLRDFLKMARDSGMSEAQRLEILGNLSAEADRLIDLMIEQFGEPDVDKG